MLGSSRAQPERTCAQGLLINLLLVLIAGLQLDYHQRRQGCVEGGRQRESNDLLPLGLWIRALSAKPLVESVAGRFRRLWQSWSPAWTKGVATIHACVIHYQSPHTGKHTTHINTVHVGDSCCTACPKIAIIPPQTELHPAQNVNTWMSRVWLQWILEFYWIKHADTFLTSHLPKMYKKHPSWTWRYICAFIYLCAQKTDFLQAHTWLYKIFNFNKQKSILFYFCYYKCFHWVCYSVR